jgi:hypothetical protein
VSGPDYSRGYLRVPLGVWLSTFCRGECSRRQLQLVAAVMRESWGWHDKEGRPYAWTRPLDAAAFSRLTGISPDHARRELRALVSRGVLAESGGRYRFVPSSERPEVTTEMAATATNPVVPEPGPNTAKDSDTNVAPDRPAVLASLLSGFAGSLSPSERERLGRWVERVGTAAAWARLEAAVEAGPQAAQAALLALLSEADGAPTDG